MVSGAKVFLLQKTVVLVWTRLVTVRLHSPGRTGSSAGCRQSISVLPAAWTPAASVRLTHSHVMFFITI